MANEDHLAILKQGVDVWNKWRQEYHQIRPDLTEADLSGKELRSVSLYRTDLRRADLSGAYLARADFYDADLREANLYQANLRRTKFEKANLGGAVLDKADCRKADFREASLFGAQLSGANLQQAQMVRTDLRNADLTGCSVYGIAAWDVLLEGTIQSDLVVNYSDRPTITVDNLEVAQLIYLLLSYEKLRDVINAVTNRGVLILGRFGGGGLELLQAIAAKLRQMKYLPIIFDFDRPRDRNYTETVKTLVGLSRFVIADLSGPSVPHELASTVLLFKLPFVPIMEKGRNPYPMFVDLLENDHVIKPIVEFESADQLLELMPSKIITPAEEKHAKRQELLDQLFSNR